MSYLVLARKYRPQTFEEILGQEATVQTLQNAIKQNRLAHAFLFTGPRGCGKTTLARVLAKAINCQAQDGPTVSPCGQCGPCKEISAGHAVDVQEIDGASNRGIDNIRELREAARYVPTSCRKKIYIIDEVHMLTTESFNALLKTLEEPPEHVAFIFATTEVQKVPATILSRCQRYDFHRVRSQVIIKHLKRLCEAEGFDLPEGALRAIAREGEGSVRDSLSLLDQVAGFGGQGLSEDEVLRILGVVDRNLVTAIAAAILAGDAAAVIDALVRADEAGHDVKQLSRELLRWFRSLTVVKVSKHPEKVLDASDAEVAELRAMTADRTLETLERHFDQLIKLDTELSFSGQPRLLLEMSLVRMAATPPLEPIAELIARLEEMEQKLRAGRAAGPALASAPLFTGEREAVPAIAPAPCSGADPGWQDFLNMVKEREPQLHSFLAHGNFAGRSGREWRLSFMPGAFGLDRIRGAKEAQRLQELMAQCLGEGHRLVVTEDQAAAAERPSPQKENGNRRREAMEDPVVKTLLEDLNGELENVKTR